MRDSGSCIFYSSDLPVEATLFGSEEVDAGADYGPSLEFGSFFQNISGIMQNTEHDCVRLRLRAPNGTLSAPTVVCRKDGPLLMLTVNDELLCRSYGIRAMPMPDAGAKPPTDVTTEPPSNATTDGSTDREASADPSPDHGPDAAASCSVFGSRNGHPSSAWEMLTTLSVVTAWRARRRRTR